MRQIRKRIAAQREQVARDQQRRVERLAVEADQMASRPDPVEGMLEHIKAEAHGALENLRDLARGIYPPLLAD